MVALYTAEILRLATNIPHLGRLDDADASAEDRSPVCGSRVAVDLYLDEGARISALGLEVQACALGQASASLMACAAIGKTAEELQEAHDYLAAFLSGTRDNPGNWPGLDVFKSAVPHTARHASILLPFSVAAQAAASRF